MYLVVIKFVINESIIKSITPPDKTFAVSIERHGCNIASLEGISIVSDSKGLKAIYEEENRVDCLNKRMVDSFAFDGKTVCYAIIDTEQMEEVEGGENSVYLSEDVKYCMMMLDINTKNETRLFSSEYNLEPVFYDKKNLYYFEYDDSVGDTTQKLYSFSFDKQTKKA